MAKTLGNYIGQFMVYDSRNSVGVWKDFMRVCVKIDIRVPLKKHKLIIKRDGSTSKVVFQCERTAPKPLI